MKVSLIIPVYNVEDFLERCLDSVQKQTYEDLEVIFQRIRKEIITSDQD